MSTATVPPCQAACPIRTDVRGYVNAIAKGDAEEAIRIIRQVNPFPSSCGRICTRLCEKVCRRAQVDEPIAIRALKRFASDRTRGLDFREKPHQLYREKIAIIGSGPSGLTAAHDLALLGYQVTVFEAQNVLGGMLREGIPDYRLPKDLVREEIEGILSLGIETKVGVALGRDFTIDDLLRDYSAVFIAVGSQKSLLPQFEGVQLPGIITAVEFLKKVSRGNIPPLGEKIVVIGGGHTAIDAARTCIRLGSKDVTIVYRRTVNEMPAGSEEAEAAEQEGIKIMYLSTPVAFSGKGKVQKVRCVRMQLEEPDASGRRRPAPIKGSDFEIDADTVILAIGYIPDTEALTKSGLDLSKKGTVIVRDDTGITNIQGVFAAGDVVSGPQSVIDAIASGRKVAEAIHRHFRDSAPAEVQDMIPLDSLRHDVAELINRAARQKMPVLPLQERTGNFEEVDLGFTKEQAVREAQRCLNCGDGANVEDTCASCLNCVRICPYGIPSPGKDRVAIDMNQCQACGICASECPASAIQVGLELKEGIRASIRKVIDVGRQENPEILVIGFYCRYRFPLGPPYERDEVYWTCSFCTGRLNESLFLYPFELGADGVIINACGTGECRFRNGNIWMQEHLRKAGKLLDETGLGSERLGVVSEEDFSRFRDKLEASGINPLRKGRR